MQAHSSRKLSLRIFLLLCLIGSCLFLSSTGSSSATPGGSVGQGIDFPSWTTSGYTSPTSFKALRRLARDHVETVTFVPTWYQAHTGSNTIRPEAGKSASDAALLRAIAYAHSLGLTVDLAPHLDVIDGSWRGYIDPSSSGAWWSNYRRFILHYAHLAKTSGVSIFVVGVELKDMTSTTADTAHWTALISRIRRSVSSRTRLTYAANWGEYEQVGFWPSLDYIGVDAYFPLPASGSNPSAQELEKAWQPTIQQLQTLSDAESLPVLFTEIGYAPVSGAYQDPWQSQSGTDYQAQETAYRAASCVISQNASWLQGEWWWEWPADQGAITTDPFALRAGLPAESVLANPGC